MSLCRVWYLPDGTVKVFHPAPKARRKDETDPEHLDRVCVKVAQDLGFESLDYEDIDSSTLPDRKDRTKWRGSKGQGINIIEIEV